MKFFDYETKTTFWEDFSIADIFGYDAIEDTFKRAFDEWKDDVTYLTELAMVLNWKIWEHWDAGNDAYGKLYDTLWRKVDEYAVNNLKGEDLTYYYRTTD